MLTPSWPKKSCVANVGATHVVWSDFSTVRLVLGSKRCTRWSKLSQWKESSWDFSIASPAFVQWTQKSSTEFEARLRLLITWPIRVKEESGYFPAFSIETVYEREMGNKKEMFPEYAHNTLYCYFNWLNISITKKVLYSTAEKYQES